MGYRGNWHQQNLSTVASRLRQAHSLGSTNTAPATAPASVNSHRDSNNFITVAFPTNNKRSVTVHSRGCKDMAGWEGPPGRSKTTMSSSNRCWTVNSIQRNTPHRRSWPGQSRLSTVTPWQQTAHQRNPKLTPATCRQVQSQTTHRHVAQLGVTRSKTSAEFAYTGRAGHSYRGSGGGDATASTLPKVQGTMTREGTAFNASSNGLVDRASALRSLASNPHLHVETVNGTTRISRMSDRRPRSLPAKFSESPLGDGTLPAEVTEPQKVIYLSKHGFHPRSKSPTYPILIGTKDTLNLALCKKLWRIRRDLEGRKARENSVVFSEISQAIIDEKETEGWYEKMFDEHEQDDEDEVDAEMIAIESLRLANSDGEFAQSDESISTVYPRPRVDLLFDRKYLKEHINDWDILGIDIEEEERKTEKRLKSASVARPTSANRKPRVPIQTTTTKPRTTQRQTMKREVNPVRTNHERRMTRLPAVPTASSGRVFRARDNRKKLGKKTKASKKPILAAQSDDELLPDLMNGDRDSRTPSPTFDFPLEEPGTNLEPVTNGDLELDDMDRRKSLISKYLTSPKPVDRSPLVPNEPEDESEKALDDVQSPVQDQEEEKPKELTEKDKFVLMRKRMEERKAKMQKRREDFLDYSMLGIRSQRRRNSGEPGAPSASKNSLGSLMSTRLESMATFKTRKYQGEEVDDEDDEDDDEDGDADDSSEEDDT